MIQHPAAHNTPWQPTFQTIVSVPNRFNSDVQIITINIEKLDPLLPGQWSEGFLLNWPIKDPSCTPEPIPVIKSQKIPQETVALLHGYSQWHVWYLATRCNAANK